MDIEDSKSLENKTALVTAGAKGIGHSITMKLLAAGARVYVCDICEESISSLRGIKGLHPWQLDVADPEGVQTMLDTIDTECGRLDILVNNAGIAGPTDPVEDISIDSWRRTLSVDLDGLFYATKYAVPLLKKSASGVIINMSSNAGLFGLPLRSPYVAAKWAIIGLTKTWAMELGPFNIRVNALCPGSIEGQRISDVIRSDARKRSMEEQAVRRVYERQSSLRRFANAEDVAELVSFLVMDSGRNISGQSIAVDGHTEGLGNWLEN